MCTFTVAIVMYTKFNFINKVIDIARIMLGKHAKDTHVTKLCHNNNYCYYNSISMFIRFQFQESL